MLLSVSVLSWNSCDITRQCLESILQNVRGIDYELIIIDNGSTDGSVEMIKNLSTRVLRDAQLRSRVRVQTIFNSKNQGFAAPNNRAYELSAATGSKYFLLLNSDTIVPPGAIKKMVGFLETHPNYGGATVKLLNPDGSTQYYMHRRFPKLWVLPLALIHKKIPRFRPRCVRDYLYLDNDFSQDFDVEQAAGACLMLRRTAVDKAGGLFDEKHFPIYYNDVDLCYRLYFAHVPIRCLTSIAITHLKGTGLQSINVQKKFWAYLCSFFWFLKRPGN